VAGREGDGWEVWTEQWNDVEDEMKLNDRELATVLAALRYWRANVDECDREDYDWFANDKPLDDEEIDELCERINTCES
jgi:hypothetical protein